LLQCDHAPKIRIVMLFDPIRHGKSIRSLKVVLKSESDDLRIAIRKAFAEILTIQRDFTNKLEA